MTGRKLVVVALGVVAAGALVWLVKGRAPEVMPSVPAPATDTAGAPVASPPSAPGVAVAAKADDAPPPPPPQALDRDVEVRTKVDAVLDKYPDVATLKNVECQPTGACQIQIQVEDLHNFPAPLELLQDPEGGLSGDHALMVLSKPVALGPHGTAPYLFTFQLTPPEGGIVK